MYEHWVWASGVGMGVGFGFCAQAYLMEEGLRMAAWSHMAESGTEGGLSTAGGLQMAGYTCMAAGCRMVESDTVGGSHTAAAWSKWGECRIAAAAKLLLWTHANAVTDHVYHQEVIHDKMILERQSLFRNTEGGACGTICHILDFRPAGQYSR